jgi:GT2 family glycosyltransferase
VGRSGTGSVETLLVSYMIATRNRREELVKTLESCRAQDYPDKEIHVVDDGSTDETSKVVRERFPEVILSRNDPAIGSIASRNQILRRAQGDVLIGFDDDSRYVDPSSTARIVERFAANPDLGLLQGQDIGPEHPERVPEGPGRLSGEWHVSSFGAGRYAVRASVVGRVGMFPEFFWHAYEEPDLAVRIWDSGFRCLQWNDIIVWHEFSSLNRDERRTHFQHARNELLSNWMRTPWPYVLPLTLWRAATQLRYSLKRGWWTVEPQVWWAALKMAPLALRHRRPVRPETFRRCIQLGRRRISDPAEAWALGR